MAEFFTDEQVLNSFEMAKKRAVELFEKVDEAEFNQKPDSKEWSIGECIGHLNKTGTLYLKQIRQKSRIEQTQKVAVTREAGGFKPRFISSLLIKTMEPPAKFSLKSPKSFQPKSQLQMEETKRKFLELQDQFMDQFKYSIKNNLLDKRITSSLTNLLKMEIGEVFLFIAAHQRRHLAQAERLL